MPTSSTSGSCTWPRQPWSRRWDRALRRLLESGLSFDYAMVRRLSAPAPPTVPELKLQGTVDLGVYDRLLVGGVR